MKKEAKNIVDIVPIAKIPLNRSSSFSYLYDQKLPVGTLVSVSFFKRNIEGIVIDNRADFHRLGNIHPVKSSRSEDACGVFNRVKFKKINEVLEENFLDANQIKLAEFISDYYFSPLGTVLKFFCPKRTKERVKNKELKVEQIKSDIELTKEQKNAVNEITKNYKQKTKKFLLFGPASSGKTEVYIHAIAKLKTQNPKRQFLILLPELTLTPQAVERYGEYFDPEEIAIINSKISKGQLYSSWQRIRSGEAKIIIGTRMAVFAPFKDLGLIVIDEEQDMSFKQWDMNPRYDARTVAEKLASLQGCQIVFGSATPRAEDYYKATVGNYKLLTLPQLKGFGYGLRVTGYEIIDMKKERWAKNYSSISKKIKSEIAYALKNKQQVILFVNKQGMSNFSVCDKCKTVLRCPKCERALLYDNSGIYKCLHCNYKTDILATCPQCKNMIFKNIGFGTQKIEREIAGLFPGARIARADNQSMKQLRAQEKLYADFKNKKIDILIGTQMISKGWDLPAVSLIGIIDADNQLAMPDFRTTERAFQNILQVSGRAGRINAKFPAVVLIQTFHPESAFFRMLAENKSEDFYKKELAEREALKLPPFSGLIKLIFQNYDKKKVEQEADMVYKLLNESKAGASEPQDAFVANIRGRHRKQIIVRIEKEVPDKIANILRNLSNGWIIDVDPISII